MISTNRKRWTAKDVEHVLLLSQDVLSLNTKVYNEESEETELGFFIEDTAPNPEELMIQEARHEKLINFIEKYLTEREANVIRLRFGFETGYAMTLEEVGQQLGITRERVRQVEAKALRKLRYKFVSKNLQMEDI